MIISNSAVAMASTHHESSYTFKQTAVMEARATENLPEAILTISEEGEGKAYTSSMKEYQERQKEDAAKRQQQNLAKSLKEMTQRVNTENKAPIADPSEDINIQILRKILAALRGEISQRDFLKELPRSKGALDLRSYGFRASESSEISVSAGARMAVGTTMGGTLWQKVTATSGTMTEAESTTFASTGLVQTKDGRSIEFNVEMSMSRAFVCEFNSLETQEYIKTDPLIINLDTNIANVTDQKFYFDLDSDGKEEQISFAGQGSGFLALDRNGDGKINDGSELFGTKSGDGFKDLAAYDEDGNGWIDEADSVFSKLKVWTKDEDGKDHLIDLKKADVGAIYLGNADTQFSLKNEEHKLNAEIKKTGIYLKESTGAAGTLNHVDLAL